ncbi:tRNA uridine-5-carboxymethylaminomethyl(34) synthesis GTPase MnmE [Vandammella animalimorsus]|uniref:tRNA modification GTPase MnmE n=1 Tax=Vandammella animalimorsus TaxID=2029117 RepID=A0A2A2B0V3_9BURK|nr:tRNA uridine-5-carboxymethylaminomethyl(34) synthesis GTPase MnmE [Vandammella animalimorsus]PAT43624.1 tRNA uridine-5-carboxymethylaminomethyl(34) synthesis GTPase MnmE [Vandammella animalimorsus]
MQASDTQPIAAIATAAGRGAVGIVRLSGRGLRPWAEHWLGRQLQPRHAHYLPFPAEDGQAIDHGLALFFPAPHSYTGEDVLELQAHGGPIVLQLLLARCLQSAAEPNPATGRPWLAQLRLAEPGEFTRRAFLNDKMDLAQAEAVADLIDASTESAARSASRSLSGSFSQAIDELRERLIHLRMLVEATLDFPEEDVDFLEAADARGQLAGLQAQLRAIGQRARQGALLRDGLHVVIAGQPNAGKSSLLNALAGAELAIVTPIAGTTRDKVEQTIQIDGVPLHIIDTAGLRQTDDVVEQIGVQRAWQALEQAQVVLFLHDALQADDPASQQRDAAILAQLHARLRSAGAAASDAPMPALDGMAAVPIVHVWNKCDAASGFRAAQPDALVLSAKTGQGLDALRQRLLQLAGHETVAEDVFMARARHVQALAEVGEHLAQAQAQLDSPAPALDLLAEELRLAQLALNRITGEFGADDLLGVIFSRFCIGK